MAIGIYGDRTPPLGELEREVLDHLWKYQGQAAQDVLNALSSRRQLTLSTVQSTLERLTRKNLLVREKRGRSFIYCAGISRAGLAARMVSDLMDALSHSGPALSLSGLLELDDNIDEETLTRLEHWLKARRERAKETPP